MEAMQAQTIDVVKRMKEITLVMQTPDNVLQEQGVTPTDIEDMLDELQDHVESIDNANAATLLQPSDCNAPSPDSTTLVSVLEGCSELSFVPSLGTGGSFDFLVSPLSSVGSGLDLSAAGGPLLGC